MHVNNGKKVKYITLHGLTHPTKFQKTSIQDATKQFASEGQEIALTAFNNYELITKSFKKNLLL